MIPKIHEEQLHSLFGICQQ